MSSEIKTRKEVRTEDTWDLSSLFAGEADFEAALQRLEELTAKAPSYHGILGKSADSLLEVLKWYYDGRLTEECVGSYAFLNWATDGSDPVNQRRMGRANQVCTAFDAALSFFRPELLSCDKVEQYMKDDPRFDDYRVAVSHILRTREHTLDPAQEKILAMMSDFAGTPSEAFGDLTNIDMDFGQVDGRPLTQSTLSSFLVNPDRAVRKEAYEKFYKGFEAHKNTIARLYCGSVKQDIFEARVRNFPDSLSAPLFYDDVPVSVYTNLIEAVHKGLPALHRFYELKRRALKLDKLAHYDVYVPLVSDLEINTTFDQAIDIIAKALAPLGEEYVGILVKGLRQDRWCDRYENKGKRSGAFSAGGFVGNPFMLTNYKEDVLRDVFTVAHEGGHSMHSYYSSHNNPFPCYDYTIFAAEVASTFNEQLVAHYLLSETKDSRMRAYIICKQLDDIVGTLFRQTMFAEFELACHRLEESGEPLTLQSLRSTYRKLLEAYFGADVELPECADLEGLRIPHFYRAFYVYKYATGISASIALSERVLNGGEQELEDYLGFLKSGGSLYPIEELRMAGVDMSKPEPVLAAVRKFTSLLDELEKLLEL